MRGCRPSCSRVGGGVNDDRPRFARGRSEWRSTACPVAGPFARRRANVARATLYRHFPSANDLVPRRSCGSSRRRVDVIFDSPQTAAELNPVDRPTAFAFALLIGPLAFGRISTLAEFDYQAVAIAAVD